MQSLPEVFSKMTPAQLQTLSSTLMEACQEAQGLMTDFMTKGSQLNAAPNPDPFGNMDAQSKVSAALIRHPERMGQATMNLFQGWMGLFQSMATGDAMPRDRRFNDPEWSTNPGFEFMRRAWALNGEWMHGLIDMVSDELDEPTRRKAKFFTTQIIDAMAPSNLPASNPAAMRALIETGGESLLNGLRQARRDLSAGDQRVQISQTDQTAFEVGKNVATAPGKVIFRNTLIEVIHYNPSGAKVYDRPMLIFPPWINKFYILDLQPENSMIRWLISKGVNLFVVSWRSADQETKVLNWDDYIELGALTALDVVTTETGAKSVNTIGYCIGGTLLTSTLAHMASVGDDRVHSATYFASQNDFENAGDLKIFTDDEALDHIESVIDSHDGMMPGELMGDTFNWLRPSDLVWRYVVDNYMLGKPPKPFDLLYWNSDQTNIPGPVHRTYLRKLYNENALSKGNFEVFGDPVNIGNVTVPVFVQAGRADHICPWESIYRGAQNFGGDVLFTLAGSGHIAGVINHPDAKKYQYWFNPDFPQNCQNWLSGAEETAGSWWPFWWEWLEPLCGDLVTAQRPHDRGLGDAPGQFTAMRLDMIAAGQTPAGPFSETITAPPKPAPARKPRRATATSAKAAKPAPSKNTSTQKKSTKSKAAATTTTKPPSKKAAPSKPAGRKAKAPAKAKATTTKKVSRKPARAKPAAKNRATRRTAP